MTLGLPRRNSELIGHRRDRFGRWLTYRVHGLLSSGTPRRQFAYIVVTVCADERAEDLKERAGIHNRLR